MNDARKTGVLYVPVDFMDRQQAAASAQIPGAALSGSSGPALSRQSTQRNSVLTLPRREVLHLTGQARRTVAYKCTALFTDVPYLRGATKSVADYLGPVIPDPATTDTAWNQRAKEWFAETYLKSTRWDASGKFSFTAWQEQLQIYTDRDGDCLVAFTEDETGMPCHRLIPALAIDDPWNRSESRWRDGVLLGDHHRQQAFHVLAEEDSPERLTSASMRDGYVIPANRAFLSANFDAVGHARGTTRFIASGNTIIDMQMMDAATHQLFNVASKIGFTITSTADGSPAVLKPLQDRQYARPIAPAPGSAETFDVTGYTEKFMSDGPVGARLDPGQTLNLHNVDRDLPDVKDIRGSDFERIAMAYGLPVQTLFCIYSGVFNLTGPGFRVSMAKSRQWRERQLEKRESLITRAYARSIEWAIRTGQLPKPQGDYRWWRCVTRYTRDYTIDEARDVRSDELRMKMGVTSAQELCREYGRDFNEVAGETIEAVRIIFSKMEALGLPLNLHPMFAGWRPEPEPNPAARDDESPDAPDSTRKDSAGDGKKPAPGKKYAA